MRAARVEAFLYRSARDPGGEQNVGLFTPAFARRSPSALSNWLCSANALGVEVAKKDLLDRQRYRFERGQFEVDGVLPAPATQ